MPARLPDGTLILLAEAWADPEKWESICDGCAKCCGLVARTSAHATRTRCACPYLDKETGRCSDYEHRPLPTCVKLDPYNVHLVGLPDTCRYIGGKGDTYDPEYLHWTLHRN